MYNNYYYPYNYPKNNRFLSNFKRINWSSFLDGTQKTLSIINQAIPVIYQIKPIYQNAKTAFKVVNELKKDNNISKEKKEKILPTISSNNSPTFFL